MTKTAFIAIVGRPNVGKSTLLNQILGEKVAIVSKRPQTTRNRITGILTENEDQFVFLDTPGLHNPRTKLGDFMVKTTDSAIGEADAAILVVEPREAVGDIEKTILDRLEKLEIPAVLAINKIDAVTPLNVAKTIEAYSAAFDFDAVVPMAAKSGKNVSILVDECRRYLNESMWFFPDDIVTDQPERQIASEIIREKILRLLSEEIPHGTAVVIEAFEESDRLLSIRAEIFCEKESHKRIILGKQGSMLKTIGSYAREDLEKFFGLKVYLDLWVKVKEKWRDSTFQLMNFGYNKKDYE
ncbi:MAG: GTPase Era [Ruminococcaceae bacterium]|nr:GTPase Era [Oscillospiraceae bacterium]